LFRPSLLSLLSERAIALCFHFSYVYYVAKVQEYGCFVRLEGVEKCRDGLAHASTYVGGEAPSAGVKLWCKVLSVSHDSGQQRIALSLNLVDQRTGSIIEPSN
jgi:predicted RNA-binding protein with RPS1 domain